MTCSDNRAPVFTYSDPCDPNRYGNSTGGGFFGDLFSRVGSAFGSFDFSQVYSDPVANCWITYPPFSGMGAARNQCIQNATGAGTTGINSGKTLAGLGIAAAMVLLLFKNSN